MFAGVVVVYGVEVCVRGRSSGCRSLRRRSLCAPSKFARSKFVGTPSVERVRGSSCWSPGNPPVG